jgi:hypothetical protein
LKKGFGRSQHDKQNKTKQTTLLSEDSKSVQHEMRWFGRSQHDKQNKLLCFLKIPRVYSMKCGGLGDLNMTNKTNYFAFRRFRECIAWNAVVWEILAWQTKQNKTNYFVSKISCVTPKGNLWWNLLIFRLEKKGGLVHTKCWRSTMMFLTPRVISWIQNLTFLEWNIEIRAYR